MGKVSVFLNLVLIPITLLAIFTGYLQQEYKKVVKDIPNLQGKLAIITGASSGGLGYHTAVHLANAGAHVVLTFRSESKGDQSLAELKKDVPSASAEIMQLDLSSLKSVKTFAEQFKAKHPGKSIDMLINNAGIMALPTRQVSAENYELQMATNHLGHFALTGLLLKSLAAGARIVNHSSSMYHFSSKDAILDDPNSELSYHPWRAYANSKLANLLFTYELNERLAAKRVNATAVAVHPGYAATHLQEGKFFQYTNWMAMSPADGALPQVAAACFPGVEASRDSLVGPRFGAWGPPAVERAEAFAHNATTQDAFWAWSAKLTGVQYP